MANEKKPWKVLGIILKKMREAIGLSQTEVAKMLGYTTAQFVSNWERGIINPPIATMKSLETIYKVTSGSIICRYIEFNNKIVMDTPPAKYVALSS